MGDFHRLDELTRIRNDFHRGIMRQPERRAELSEHCSRVEEARRDETVRLIRSGIAPDKIRSHLQEPELLDPAETGIPVPTGEAEAHFSELDRAREAEPEAGA